jgi:hypothetical protein
MLLRKCANREPSEEEELEADQYTDLIEAYCPGDSPHNPSVNMSTAVALINRYGLGAVTLESFSSMSSRCNRTLKKSLMLTTDSQNRAFKNSKCVNHSKSQCIHSP